MSLLNRDQFFSSPKLPTEDIQIPELGGPLRVRGLTGAERDKWEANLVPDRRTGKVRFTNLRAKLVALCVVDENGDRMFRESDIAKIGAMPARVLQRIFDAAQRLSGFDEGELEDMLKNSDETPGN